MGSDMIKLYYICFYVSYIFSSGLAENVEMKFMVQFMAFACMLVVYSFSLRALFMSSGIKLKRVHIFFRYLYALYAFLYYSYKVYYF